MKDFLKDYLSFNAKERTGIIIILLLILAGTFLPFVYNKFASPSTITADPFYEISKPDSGTSNSSIHFENKKQFNDVSKHNNTYDKSIINIINNHSLFFFDPNKATDTDWGKLGLKSRTIYTIKHYLAKGGHFYKPEDLGKIYGLSRQDANRLIPYVKIPRVESVKYDKPITNNNSVIKKVVAGAIDINSADSTLLETLPGIGPGYSRRIIRFRDKLGGFYNIDQVSETFGLPDSTFKKIKDKIFLTPDKVKKMNINTADLEQLRSHPYIRYKLANSIIEYRNQHGSFNNLSELKNIIIVNEELFKKIEPYLTIH